MSINSVLHSEVINLGDITFGYLVYQHFLASSVEELDAVFKEFQNNNIDDIVIDLRYNAGGQTAVAQHLGSLIAGEYAIKRDFVKLEYNDHKSERNLTRPLDIYLVGDDTHGKPVGSLAVRHTDSTLIPITFRYMNRKNEGDFFDGLPANSYIEEDITKDFGEPEESLLQEVLYYIENDSFTGTGVKKSIPADVLQWDRIPHFGAI